jgi:hypothetical protein
MLTDGQRSKAALFGRKIRDYEDLGFDTAARQALDVWNRFCRQMDRHEFREAGAIFQRAYLDDPMSIAKENVDGQEMQEVLPLLHDEQVG